jgi:hypothetical protein
MKIVAPFLRGGMARLKPWILFVAGSGDFDCAGIAWVDTSAFISIDRGKLPRSRLLDCVVVNYTMG